MPILCIFLAMTTGEPILIGAIATMFAISIAFAYWNNKHYNISVMIGWTSEEDASEAEYNFASMSRWGAMAYGLYDTLSDIITVRDPKYWAPDAGLATFCVVGTVFGAICFII